MTDTQPRASIDDLLQYVEEPEAPIRRQQMGVRWAVRAALLAGALTALTVFGLRLVGLGISAVAVFAGFLALLLIRRVSARLTPPARPRQARRPARRADGPDWSAASDALRAAVSTWKKRLTWADGDRDTCGRVVLPRLGELTDERLRQRHGITRASEPERARALLGEQLWTMLEGRADRPPTAGECAAIVSQLEKL